MDIIEILLQNHALLRAEFAALAAPFKRAHGVGWDDCVALDMPSLSRDIHGFFEAFKKHEKAEDELLAEVSGLLELDKDTRAAFLEGRRAMGEIMKLFSVVAFSCDGEHVHRVRELLSRLGDELESHLAFKEKTLFPVLRKRLPAELLRELGRQARAGRLRRHAHR